MHHQVVRLFSTASHLVVICCLVDLHLCIDLDISSEGSAGRDLHVYGADSLRLVLTIPISLVNLTVAL